MSNFDVIIAGGAIIGSSCAWFLSQQAGFNGRVLVIEKDPAYRTCSTTLSVSSIRQQFSTKVNIRISRFGFEFLKTISEQTAKDGGIGLVEKGYLLLADETGAQRLRQNVQLQRSEGADIGLLEPAELVALFPWLNVEDVALASLGLSGEGWFDAYSLLQFFKSGACKNGVVYIQGEVAGLEVKAGHVTGVTLTDGSRYGCGHFVNACGTGAAHIAQMAGIGVHIEARKRCVFVIDCREREKVTGCPHLIDSTGVWVKPKGQYFITGTTPPVNADYACNDFDVDYPWTRTRSSVRIPRSGIFSSPTVFPVMAYSRHRQWGGQFRNTSCMENICLWICLIWATPGFLKAVPCWKKMSFKGQRLQTLQRWSIP